MHANDLDISWIASLPKALRTVILNELTEAEAAALIYDWGLWAREKQRPPAWDWRAWLILAGRGWGKTRCGAEWVRAQVERGGARRIALVARTAADARDVMIEGDSGLLAVCPPWNRPLYEPSKRRLTWPNGAIATAYSGDRPDQLRGPQHEFAWCDELCAWRYPQAFDNLLFGLRLGDKPQVVITTTPRPSKRLRELIDDPSTALTVGSTFENAANLAPGALALLRRKYAGTRLGLQELEARILDDAPGALWRRETLDANRVLKAPALKRIVVAVDPAASSNAFSDETGIIAAGLGADGHGYVLDDESLTGSPDAWARAAVTAYHKYKADRVIGEANNGGEMVAHTVRTVDSGVPFTTVRAARGKAARAEPIAALYEQGRVHHVGAFPALEDQMCGWAPGDADSPDRVDALVWALSALLLDDGGGEVVIRRGKIKG
jgi:phage terminase large subunit-like protein